MRAVSRVVGRGLPLPRADVDTDQIIPASNLKRVDSSGYGDALFGAWRSDPAFVLNDERYKGAKVLVAGPNFGCGSSREHAAWALRDAGFEAVVSSKLADIFRMNCVRSGVVPVTLPAQAVGRLLRAIAEEPRVSIAIDVSARLLVAPGLEEPFELDDHARRQLVEGLDEIGLTLAQAGAIDAYEAGRPEWLPCTAAPA
ncbi:MAG: 3-isopropylmalate dehydratase small subunit [Candidatus Limnocylindria bacterium]